MINDLVAHERRVLDSEYMVKRGQGLQLKDGLITQMREKEHMHRSEMNAKRDNGTSLNGVGMFDKFGNANYNLKDDISAKANNRAHLKASEVKGDAAMVKNLSQYDKYCVEREQAVKQALQDQWNSHLQGQMAQTEARNQHKLDKKKAAGPKTWGKDTHCGPSCRLPGDCMVHVGEGYSPRKN